MGIDLIIELWKASNIYFLLAGFFLIIDVIFFKNIFNIIKFHWKTLLFLLPFVFILFGSLQENPSEKRTILTIATILLAILFLLLNKMQDSIAKDKAVESVHAYNYKIVLDVIEAFKTTEHRSSKFYVVPFVIDIYKENINYIFSQSNVEGNSMLQAIVEMEKSNNIMQIVQNMNIDGVTQGHRRKFLEECNSNLLDSSENIRKLLFEKRY